MKINMKTPKEYQDNLKNEIITKTKTETTKLIMNAIIKDGLFANSNISTILNRGRSDSYVFKSVTQNITQLSKEKHKDKMIKNYTTF